MLDNDNLMIIDLGEAEPLYCFDNKASFESWAKTKKEQGEALIEANNEALAARAHFQKLKYPELYPNPDPENLPQGYWDYLKQIGKENPNKASGKQSVPLHLQGIVTVLYDLPGYAGASFTTYLIPYPSFGAFNGRAESFKAFLPSSINQLCARTWFRGARVFYIGFTHFNMANLAEWNFANRAHSLWR